MNTFEILFVALQFLNFLVNCVTIAMLILFFLFRKDIVELLRVVKEWIAFIKITRENDRERIDTVERKLGRLLNEAVTAPQKTADKVMDKLKENGNEQHLPSGSGTKIPKPPKPETES